jgi:hypothetical protein
MPPRHFIVRERTHLEVIWEFVKDSPKYLRVRPDTGHLGLDIAYLLVICAAHAVLSKSFLATVTFVDLVTPWVVIHCVRLSFPRAMVIMTLGALFLETRTNIASGTYLCAFWCITVMLMWLRDSISWIYMVPWTVIFAASAVWIVVLETAILILSRGLAPVDPLYIFKQITHILLVVMIGNMICYANFGTRFDTRETANDAHL